MSHSGYSSSAQDVGRGGFEPSSELIGFEKASRLIAVGGGCLLLVLIFGIILCRLDMSAGKKRRALLTHQVEH